MHMCVPLEELSQVEPTHVTKHLLPQDILISWWLTAEINPARFCTIEAFATRKFNNISSFAMLHLNPVFLEYRKIGSITQFSFSWHK